MTRTIQGAVTLMFVIAAVTATPARGHCDSLDGPVIRDAQVALERADPTPVLKWVTAHDEADIRAAFAQALAVRALGAEAKTLADRHFFETLVRVHRAGEGEAYTGLKPAGSVEHGIAMADRALEAGSSKGLSRDVSGAVAREIQKRFELARERGRHADESVAAGREYVEAYVAYIHFVESLDRLLQSGAPHTHAEHAGH